MFSRGVDVADVRAVLETGSVVEGYPDDEPHPSKLILAFVDERPLHVVAAFDADRNETIVITVYRPSPSRWNSTFRRRRP